MKKAVVGIAVLAVALIALNAYAWKVPTSGGGVKGSMESNVKEAGRTAVVEDTNKKIRKKNCRFTNSTTEYETTCNLDSVIQDMQKTRDALKGTTLANSVRVTVTAHAKDRSLGYKRAENVRDKLRNRFSWWNYNVSKMVDGTNKLDIVLSAR